MKRPVVLAGAAAAFSVALVLGTALPASATTTPAQSCRINGASVGSQFGYLYTTSVYTRESGQCGTLYVQGRYYAYQGGPSYLSGWISSSTEAAYSHNNMYRGWHYSSYNTNVQDSWF